MSLRQKETLYIISKEKKGYTPKKILHNHLITTYYIYMRRLLTFKIIMLKYFKQ